ncbi:triokinase/FMN cyclase-like isoform X2 [Watersipora subatra]|uniref:triokinase/FMN cyclase-like isoform X2 n=1 Tax=Watersipora subatra TaxID=2589382 RepID=UPI00355B8526
MTSKKIINSAKTVVDDAIAGLVLTNSGLTTIGGGRIVIREDVEDLKASEKVAVISGGGSGHEPAWAGFVGPGSLTAAVCGDIFASPPSSLILEAVIKCSSSAGILMIVTNYTGDRVNFGLALERARAIGLKCEMVVSSDDTALTSADRSAGRRGLCGTMLLHKVAGAMSEEGKTLEEIVATCKQMNQNMGTIGVSLGSCSLPGNSQPHFTIAEDEVELGLGIHGEAGVKKMKLLTAKALVAQMYDHMTNSHSVSHLTLTAGEHVAVIVNNLGGTSYLELNVVAKEVLQLCAQKDLNAVRVYCGTFVTCLNMPGISITFLKVDDELLGYLDSPTQAPAWSFPYKTSRLSSRVTHDDVTDSASVIPSSVPSSADHALLSTTACISADSGRLMKEAIMAACHALTAATQYLNELDEGCGDGDTGSTLALGSTAILDYLESASAEEISKPAFFLSQMSSLIERQMGGTSGALYSLFLSAAASTLVSEVSTTSLTEAFSNGIAAIMKYGLSQAGDRTMLDALIPALAALRKEGAVGQLLRDSVMAAREGADSTAGMKAKAGRASYTPQESQTRVDPGAEGAAIWIKAAFMYLVSQID